MHTKQAHTVTVRQSVTERDRFFTRIPNGGRCGGGKRKSNGETDYRQYVSVCLGVHSCSVCTIVNGCVHCKPLEDPAPCEYPPWQPATLGRFAQLSSRSCVVLKQTRSGALHSTHTVMSTHTHTHPGRGRVSFKPYEFDLEVIVVTLVCNFERIIGIQHSLTHSVSSLSLPPPSPCLLTPLSPSPSPPLIVIDSAACVRLCSHAVGGRRGTHKQHRATF